MLPFLAFPSIEGLHNIVRFTEVYPDFAKSPVYYRGKVKLHGTNAGITIHNGEVLAQSRTQGITPQNDNAGFAAYVESNKEYWAGIKFSQYPITIFGEWCGQGIMKGTAISQIGRKVFAVFAVVIHNDDDKENHSFISEPYAIDTILGENRPDTVHTLPWYGESVLVDYADRESMQAAATYCSKVVDKIEPCDPWVKQVFGVEGTAEGVVYYPTGGEAITYKRFSDFAFKAKGEKHKTTKTKDAVQVNPEVAASVGEFVTLVVTPARLEQGLEATGGKADMKNMGDFLKWFNGDVQKESMDELEVSKLLWSDVAKSVQGAARKWYMEKAKAI
jgi:hypothetical protein